MCDYLELIGPRDTYSDYYFLFEEKVTLKLPPGHEGGRQEVGEFALVRYGAWVAFALRSFWFVQMCAWGRMHAAFYLIERKYFHGPDLQ